ncbi:Protein O-mannosyltransferase 2 [Dimargaris xerosporica]|nr:Protein O-mannosyltransferase 2 [Dimargaris xerosporica]
MDTRRRQGKAVPEYGMKANEPSHLAYSTEYAEKQGRTPLRPTDSKYRTFWWENERWLIPTILTVLALFTHYYKITWSSSVVWDEAHFGKFASYYLKGTFYHDVHPPLGKMLVALSGLIAGYRGGFEFKSGVAYPEDMRYGVMRAFNATFGVALVPLAYFTALQLRLSRNAAILAALFVLCDNALTTISRFILLDSILLFFTALTLFCLCGFHNQRDQPFSVAWWKWLLLTGGALGGVASVKWVGFFVILLVGLYTAEQLYWMLGERNLDWRKYAYHWTARIAALIVLPVLIYLLCFKIHFLLLHRSGPGDATMSSLFQSQLGRSNLKDNPLNIAYGSTVTLKGGKEGVGLLHSHVHKYPIGSKQQQITCYGHKDNNNNFIIAKPHGQEAKQGDQGADQVEFIKDGSIIRLVHANTGVNLHSHRVEAPINKGHWEVSGYGNGTIGDNKDHWRVEIYDDFLLGKKNKPTEVRSLLTRFRLRHVVLGCVLRGNRDTLPQWGWKQHEVTCDPKTEEDTGNLWNVEYHRHEKLPPAPSNAYKTNFLGDVIHLNIAMAATNNALVPNRDKIDILSSEPHEWPFMTLGLRMCGWQDTKVKFYLMGNPIIWWSVAFAAFAFPALLLYYLVRNARHYRDWKKGEWAQFLHNTKMLWGGWALHYFPFFVMGRVTYLHHYFPAVYFGMLYLAFLLDHFGRRLFGGRFHDSLILAMGAASVAAFLYFAPFTFGFDYPAKELASRKWLSSWNIY